MMTTTTTKVKCGTNTLADLLRRHPRIQINTCSDSRLPFCNAKYFQGDAISMWEDNSFVEENNTATSRRTDTNLNENLDFDSDYVPDRFSQVLPRTDGKTNISMGKSPAYLMTQFYASKNVAHRIKAVLPHTKVIVTLCNPTERLFSEWNHHQRFSHTRQELYRTYSRRMPPQTNKTNNVKNRTTIPSRDHAPVNFAEFVDLLRPNHPLCTFRDNDVNNNTMTTKKARAFCRWHRRKFLSTGEYRKNLEPWETEFGRENLLLLNMEDSQQSIVRQVLNHVGSHVLPLDEYPWSSSTIPKISFQNTQYGGRRSGYTNFTKAMTFLDQYYLPHNEALARFVGHDWPLRWSCRVGQFDICKLRSASKDGGGKRGVPPLGGSRQRVI